MQHDAAAVVEGPAGQQAAEGDLTHRSVWVGEPPRRTTSQCTPPENHNMIESTTNAQAIECKPGAQQPAWASEEPRTWERGPGALERPPTSSIKSIHTPLDHHLTRLSSFSEGIRGGLKTQPTRFFGRAAPSIQSCLVRVKPGLRPWRPELLRQTVGQSIHTL